MEIFQLVGIAFVTAVAALILKNTKPELAFAVTVTGSIILLLFTFEMFKSSLSIFQTIADTTGIDSSLIKILLKMVGIGYLVEFSAGILNDFGQNSVADKLVFCGKVVVLILAIPILESVLSLISRLLGLIS
ncbi:MAG: stage III sporulation AC/AD family protein [Clostridia bacterium]|nr:stage III sporulation AC/AD family protein [Clostridia bacterium]